MSFPPSSSAFDLSELIAQTQSRLASSGPSASSGGADPGASSAGFLSPEPTGGVSVRSTSASFFTPPGGGRDASVLGEFSSGGGVPSSGSSGVFPIFKMSADVMPLLCCGISSGLKFCTAGKTTCTVRQHQKKFAVTLDDLYIAGPRNKAYQEISVASSKVPSESLNQLLLEKYSLEAWQRLFAAVSQSNSKLDETEFDNLKRRTLTSSSIGVTPRKKMERYDEEPSAGEETSADKLSPIGTLLMAEVEDADTEVLAAQMDKILTLAKDNAAGLDKLRREVGADIDRLEVAVQEIACKAGTDPGVGEAPMLSAWEGIAYVNTTLNEVAQASGNLHSEMAASRRRVEDLENKVDVKNENRLKEMENRFIQVETLAKLLFAENQKLSAAIKARPSGSSAFTFGIPPREPGVTLESEKKIQGLEEYVKNLEARVVRAETRGLSTHNSMGDPERAAQVGLLEAKLKTLEARVSSKPVTVAGRTFLSLPDVEAWVAKHAPASGSYLYHDCVSLLENLNATDMCRTDIITDIYQTQKVGLKAEAEARQIASFRITLPSIFCGNQKELTVATTGKHFPGCKTFTQWNAHDGYSGLKFTIERGLVDIRSSIKYDIDSILEDFPEAKSFANDLHGLAHTWINEYVSWLDSFISELKTISGCSIEAAFELGTKCGKRVFEELRRERSMAANANSEPSQARRTAKYLYATLRAHTLMQEFLDRGFRDHSSIFPVINFHLYQTTVSRITVDKHVLDLKNDIKKIEARCNQIDTLSSKVQKLTNPSGTGSQGGAGRGRGGGRGGNSSPGSATTDPE